MNIVYDKKCPICGNNKMIKNGFKDANYKLRSTDSIAIGTFTIVYANRYICYECGYQMDFYEDRQLDKLRKKASK